MPRSLPSLSAFDSAAFAASVALPTLAQGIILRRPAMVAAAERFGLDAGAVRQMQRLRRRYGENPLLIRNPIRPQVLLLSPRDVRRVLAETPAPFSPASCEKRAALSHFEPHVSLVTQGEERRLGRALSDSTLESGCPVHSLRPAFHTAVEVEIGRLLHQARALGALAWPLFFGAWMRIVRRTVLGASAVADTELTDLLDRLRARANWAFAAPSDRRRRDAFHRRLEAYLRRAEPHSLAALAARFPEAALAHPSHQMAQWLFAFDPAGMTAFRALALLAAHPAALERGRAEAMRPGDLAFLRAAILETVRLYPTTPAILRQTSAATEWPNGELPAGAGLLIFTPFFQRDDERLADAHRFVPERWLGLEPDQAIPLVPFSAGPAACPARHLVPLVAAEAVAAILRRGPIELQGGRLDHRRALPGTLDHFTLVFDLPL
ncbi:cytochrome P450 [Aureimonas endophytica]|uniref:cytochrome P450 n=1 Tax=Aureimonas endophytica TaxID=2027858 RepID=UPI00166CD77B|nr:cytochrome P450 [Aureimonas endophytica]